jgi:acetyl-CoA carboxylase biotin carboxyl carrier protein
MSKKPSSAKTKVKAAASAAGSPMNTDLLQQIIKLMSANDLNMVDLRDGDKRVILRRGAVVAPVQMSMSAAQHAAHAAPIPAPVQATIVEKPAEDAGLVAIKSPMVGTFYSSPSPDAKPFVSVGSSVSDDTDVCIIEAMKVFNNIKAECRGTIAKVLISNGQTVEFGQTLFLVKP